MSLRLTRRPRLTFRRGFTLIELLVVIAIISILASMIFPSFSRARESARRVDCSSNLRQIGFGITMYTSDYDERFPIGYPFWLQPASDRQLSRTLYPYLKSYQVWSCKSWTGVYIPDSEEGNYSFVISRVPATLDNGVIGVPNDVDPTTQPMVQRPRADASLQRPSTYPLLFCGADPVPAPDLFHGHTLLNDAGWANGAISGTNVLYGDMHVKWWKGTRGGWDNFYNTPLDGG